MATQKIDRNMLNTGIVDNSNATAITIDSSENVGIGATSPATALEVIGTDPNNNVSRVVNIKDDRSYAADVGGSISLFGKYNSGGSYSTFAQIIGAKTNGTDGEYSGYLSFKTRSTSALPTERMRIDSAGDARFAANATGGALIKGVSGNQTDRNTGGYPQFTFVGNEGTGMRRVSSNVLAFDTSGAESMRIDSSGNVGLGTTSPKVLSGQKSLSINASVPRIDFKVGDVFKHHILCEAEYMSISADSDNSQSNSRVVIEADNAAVARFDSDGIKFGSATAAADALDDYEEGTFSPTLSNAYNITSLTLSEAGRYTKVGSLVHFEFQVTGSFTNAAVESRFSFTVPFNIATSSSRATGMFSHHLTSFSNGRFNNGQIFQGTTVDTASWVYISTNQLSGTGSFTGRGTFTYVAA